MRFAEKVYTVRYKEIYRHLKHRVPLTHGAVNTMLNHFARAANLWVIPDVCRSLSSMAVFLFRISCSSHGLALCTQTPHIISAQDATLLNRFAPQIHCTSALLDLVIPNENIIQIQEEQV